MTEALSTVRVLVVGDIVDDHHLYEGERPTPMIDDRRGVTAHDEKGGAALLHTLLERTAKKHGLEKTVHTALGLKPDESPGLHAYAVWRPCLQTLPLPGDKTSTNGEVWRTSSKLGYGGGKSQPGMEYEAVDAAVPPDILVLDDGGFHFRQSYNRAVWRIKEAEEVRKLKWIVLKTVRPIAQGDLWHELATKFSDRLVCIVSIEDLRHECVGVSRGLSWERTVVDLLDALDGGSALSGLKKCKHLIVRMSVDAALWIERTEKGRKIKLVFDPERAEGEFMDGADGAIFGYSSIFTTAVVLEIARALKRGEEPEFNFVDAIRRAISASRNLFTLGHGEVSTDNDPKGFPYERIAAEMRKPSPSSLAEVDAPDDEGKRRDWRIIEAAQGRNKSNQPLFGVARQLVLYGKSALTNYPHASFGKLLTIDRKEIETLRSLKKMMIEFKRTPKPERPLSIGVFGPPGAGKSFGVKQISNQVFGEDAWLQFNLSQFDRMEDFIGALHQVRDKVLSGVTPVVFWDEFDSSGNRWLKDFLAPMYDGRFQEGQISHWVGKSVFIFAGGTRPTYQRFGREDEMTQESRRPEAAVLPANGTPSAPDEELEAFRAAKGPDFHSRLDAFYDVLGPNPREKAPSDGAVQIDPTDIFFPVRRAFIIRKALNCKMTDEVEVDPDLLDALLLAPKYTHGARSLEKLVAPLSSRYDGAVRRSSLPGRAVIGMHVDADEFERLIKRNDNLFHQDKVEKFAEILHKHYLAANANDAPAKPPSEAVFQKPFNELDDAHKESSRAAVRRIPHLLAMVDLAIARRRTTDAILRSEVEACLKRHLELLAKVEHQGWMKQRKDTGWRWAAKRNDETKEHDCMVDYEKLEERSKENDKRNIRFIPELVEQMHYSIVWLSAGKPDAAQGSPEAQPARKNWAAWLGL